jgi:hypothetical protein
VSLPLQLAFPVFSSPSYDCQYMTLSAKSCQTLVSFTLATFSAKNAYENASKCHQNADDSYTGCNALDSIFVSSHKCLSSEAFLQQTLPL